MTHPLSKFHNLSTNFDTDQHFSTKKRIIPKLVYNFKTSLQIFHVDFFWSLVLQSVVDPLFIVPLYKFLQSFIWMFFLSFFHCIKPLLHLSICLWMVPS